MRHTALSVAAAGVAAGLALAPAAAIAAPAAYVFTWQGGDLVQYTDLVAGTGDVVPTTEEVFGVAGLDVAADGTGYAVDYGGESHLYSVSVATGAVADLGVLTFGGDAVVDCTGLDLAAGVLTVVCDTVPGQPAGSVYLTVDPSTLETTLVVASSIRAASIATDPTDGQLYGFGYNGEIMAIEAGSAVELGFTSGFTTIWGADFDADGTLWGTVSNPTVEVVVGDFDFVAAAMNPGGNPAEYAENLTVIEALPAPAPEPQLAATGSESAPVLFGAVALIALGAAVAATAAVRRREV